METVIEALETVIGPDARTLPTSAARDARSFDVRALAAWAIIQFSNATLSELAKYCDRNQSTMSCAARRIEELRDIRPDLADKMKELRTALTRHADPDAKATRRSTSPFPTQPQKAKGRSEVI